MARAEQLRALSELHVPDAVVERGALPCEQHVCRAGEMCGLPQTWRARLGIQSSIGDQVRAGSSRSAQGRKALIVSQSVDDTFGAAAVVKRLREVQCTVDHGSEAAGR